MKVSVTYYFDREKNTPVKCIDAGPLGLLYRHKGEEWDYYYPPDNNYISPIIGWVLLETTTDPNLSWSPYRKMDTSQTYMGLVLGDYVLFMLNEEYCSVAKREEVESHPNWLRVEPDMVGW